VQNLDFAETFLDIAGQPIPPDMQGRSLVPLLKGQTPADWRKAIYYHYFEYPAVHAVQRHYGIRTDRYKLIDFYNINEWELYDLKTDPDELRNVLDEPQYAAVVKDLKAQLEELRKQYQDPEDTRPAPGPGMTRWPEGQRPAGQQNRQGRPNQRQGQRRAG
jgi:arylsulfatase A-like enzyme